MAEVLHSSRALFSTGSCTSRGAAANSRACVSLPASRFWGDFRHLSLRHREQQIHHCQALKPASFHKQVMNTAPWLRWWDKDGAPNMLEIHSMQEFIDALSDAGERLVIVDFYARHCNGCRTLYPKLCKIAREHPEVLFLKINYDENSDICKALSVKVLPLFFVYRAQGHLESFTCTIAKIQRLRDAIAKYSTVHQSDDEPIVPAVVGSLLAKAGSKTSSQAVAI